jgi:hypothetical protein
MYFDPIDDLIDGMINDFSQIFLERFQQNLGENFVQRQIDINDLIMTYIEDLDNQIFVNVSNKSIVINRILDFFRKYAIIYSLLTFGSYSEENDDIFIGRIIEFTNNQSKYPMKIDNFFNSESNSLIIDMYYVTKNCMKLAEKLDRSYETIQSHNGKDKTIEFLEEIGEDYYFNMIIPTSKNTSSLTHNLIKIIIIVFIYKKYEKKILFDMIEQDEIASDEYMFIDIVEQTDDTINFNAIETLISHTTRAGGYVFDIWDFMEKTNLEEMEKLTPNDKINKLINSGLIVPILDDFMLYDRESEKYDKYAGTEINKKKEDTKLKYIVEKIDGASELYSNITDEKREKIMRYFNTNVPQKKAILKNESEDIKIINKYLNQGKRSLEISDNLSDFVNYKRYAYINFKDFKNEGFSVHFTKSVPAIRAVTFDKQGPFKQNINDKIQLRVGPKNTFGNIVGFAIPTNIDSMKCIKVREMIDVRDLSTKTKNGFKIFYSFFVNSRIQNKPHKSSVYWLFDKNYDKVTSKTASSLENVNSKEIFRNMMSVFYDYFIRELLNNILINIDMIDNPSFDDVTLLLQSYEKNMRIKIRNEMINDVEKYFMKIHKKTDEQTKQDQEIIYGIEGDIMRLPKYKDTAQKNKNSITVDVSKITVKGELIEKDVVIGVCQHNISWDELSRLHGTDQNEHARKLYMFIQKYAIVNTQQQLVCKSCGFCINIQKYVQDGNFDEETKRFVTSSMPLEMNLEEIPEYIKFAFTIKILDKDIGKIAQSVGIPYFLGSSSKLKWRRKTIIKSVIDTLIKNHSYLTKNKERNNTKYDKYGLIKGLTQLFIFEFDNNIYQASSKDKDQEQYRIKKKNNIMTHIIIFLLLEMNESQVSFFVKDKKGLCDISFFDNVYRVLFSDLKILKNNSGDTVDIKNYIILCYVIYIISCRIAKHKLWIFQHASEKNVNKMIPIIQKQIVHTLVDILNSILEHSFQDGADYIFEMFRIKFYSSLSGFFGDREYFDLMLESERHSNLGLAERSGMVIIDDSNIPPFSYVPSYWRMMPVRYYLPTYIPEKIDLHVISNLTNCPGGNFHSWKVVKGHFVCSICSVTLFKINYDAEQSEKIMSNYKKWYAQEIAQKYCIADGNLHTFEYDEKEKKTICTKCKFPLNHKYSEEQTVELKIKINKVVDEKISYRIDKKEKQDEMINSNIKYVDDVIKNIIDKKNKQKSFDFVETFSENMRNITGEELLGGHKYDVYNDVYILDHDYKGSKREKILIIKESEKKISIKHDHKHYGMDVLHYTDNTSGRVDVFYDPISKKLLGYKEQSREYFDYDNSDNKIQINYSLANKLKLLGLKSEYYDTKDNDFKYINKLKGIVHIEQLRYICRERMDNLKQIMVNLFVMINRIIFNWERNTENFDEENPEYFQNKTNTIINKYKSKLRIMNIKSSSGKHQIFKHWKAISRGIFPDRFTDIENKPMDIIPAEYICDIDEKGNLILFYIVEQFDNLIKFNNDNTTQKYIADFLIETIDTFFHYYNQDKIMSDGYILRFSNMIKSDFYTRDIGEDGVNFQGVYEEPVDTETKLNAEEIKKENDEKFDLEEEMNSLDVENVDDIDDHMEYYHDIHTEWKI